MINQILSYIFRGTVLLGLIGSLISSQPIHAQIIPPSPATFAVPSRGHPPLMCAGSACDYHNPNTYGCSSSASTIADFTSDYQPGYYPNITYTELRYSSLCNVVWARTTIRTYCIYPDCAVHVGAVLASIHNINTDDATSSSSGSGLGDGYAIHSQMLGSGAPFAFCGGFIASDSSSHIPCVDYPLTAPARRSSPSASPGN